MDASSGQWISVLSQLKKDFIFIRKSGEISFVSNSIESTYSIIPHNFLLEYVHESAFLSLISNINKIVDNQLLEDKLRFNFLNQPVRVEIHKCPDSNLGDYILFLEFDVADQTENYPSNKFLKGLVKLIRNSDGFEDFIQLCYEQLKKNPLNNNVYIRFVSNDSELFYGEDTLKEDAQVLSKVIEQEERLYSLVENQLQKILSSSDNEHSYWKGLKISIQSGIQIEMGFFTGEKSDRIISDNEFHGLADELQLACNFKITASNLVQAKMAAEKSDKLKTSFLANMSHEIRTPMNAIVGFSGIIARDELEQKEKDFFFKQIKENSNYLLGLIENIIDISKIESGNASILNNRFDLNLMFSELLNMFSMELQKQNKSQINIEARIPQKETFMVFSDEKRIRQIFRQLLSNAVKYTEQGFIEFGYDVIGSEKLQFYVKDSGLGIPPEFIHEIFNSFTKFSESKTKLYRGTGIGLAICRQITDLLGGDIWVDSQPGMGSTFFFTIPYKKVIAQIQTEQKSRNKKVIHLLKDSKILIAEDSNSNRELLESYLSKSGAKLLFANDGLQTLEMVKQSPDIKLLLLDIRMPGIDGYTITREIKANYRNIKIIAQTAYAFEKDKADAFEAGVDEFITKPILPEQLYRKIQSVFESENEVG